MPDPEASQLLDYSTILRASVKAGMEREGLDLATGKESAAVWLSTKAVDPDTGRSVLNRSSAHKQLTDPRTGVVGIDTIRALAALFGISRQTLWIANGVEIGFGAPPGGMFAAALPGCVDQLPTREQMHLRDGILLFCRAHGLID